MCKKICSLILSTFLLFNIAGCTSSKTKVNTDSVTIKFSWWGTEDRYDKTMKAIKLFEEKNPNIKVKAEFGEWTGFTKRMQMKILGNDEADLMQVNYDWLETYSKDGTGFYDLSKVSDELDLDNFSEDYLSYGRKNGILNAIPISTNAKVLYYNKDLSSMFVGDKYTTWDELINSSSKNNKFAFSADEFDIWSLCMAYEQQNSGKAFINSDGTLGFSEENIKELLDFYKILIDNKVVSPKLNKDGNVEFNSNNSACTVSWSSDAAKVEKNMDKIGSEAIVGAFPSFNGEKPISYVKPTSLYAISKNTEYPKEASKLMNFMLNDPEAAEILGLDRGIPASTVSYNAVKDSGILTGLQYDANSIINDTNEVLISPYYENTFIKNVCDEAIEEITYGKSTPDTCAKTTYDSLVKTLQTIEK